MKHAVVLGAGAWGTALAMVLADRAEKVTLFTRREEHARELNQTRENARYLKGASFPPRLEATSDLSFALSRADVVLVVVPSHGLRALVRDAKPHLPTEAPLLIATKGIENESLMLMTEVAEDVLGAAASRRIATLSGPSFAQDVARGMPTAVVIASKEPAVARVSQEIFPSARLRVYTSDDPVGVELGGALKNVVAIAAGACDGLGYGQSARAALITRGLAEMVRLARAKGGNALTLAGLAGLGDLVLTCTGELSRNRTVGVELGKGRKLRDILASLGHVAEGVRTAQSAYDLGKKLDVELPIMNQVHAVLYGDKEPRDAVTELMARELKPEF